jgi:hypothetical protein
MIIAIFVLVGTVILAISVAILLTPFVLWLLFSLMNKLSDKITNSKHHKVNSCKNNMRKINYTNYGFSFSPLQIGKNKSIYKGYITYLKHSSNDNLNDNCLIMVDEPFQQSCGKPINESLHYAEKFNILKAGVQLKGNRTESRPVWTAASA